MSPKYALYDPLQQRWLSWTKFGPSWKTDWKHATKWPSQYQAKLFREEHHIYGVVPLMVLPRTEEVSLPEKDAQTAHRQT